MEIRRMKLSEIRGAEWNPRVALKPGDAEFEKLRRSIKEFGVVQVLVWNKRSGALVGGHQRLAVMCDEGVEEADVCVVDLAPDKERALNIALNQIQGSWDESKLATLLDELCKIPDFDVSLTGFESEEIGQLFDEYLTLDSEDGFDLAKGAEGITNPITQKGDLIELGRHRLLCGDAGSSEDLRRLLGDSKIQLIYTDPPYNCAYDSQKRPVQTAFEAKWKPIANDSMDQAAYEKWLGDILKGVTPFLDQGAPGYLWNGHRQFGPMHAILTSLGFHVSNVITWVKPSAAPGYGDYWMGSEFMLYFWFEENGAHRWFGPKGESNVWECPRDGANTLVHPTAKPVALAQRAIKNSSQRGDLVLDCFAGSGSTIIAAQSMERICCAMELEPSYCEAITRRYIKTFGRGAVTDEVFQKYSSAGEVPMP